MDYSYTDFLPAIRSGGFNNYGVTGPNMVAVKGYTLNVFGSRTEYFYTANVNDIVGCLPLGNYEVVQLSSNKYSGYDWVIFRYNGGEYWTALIDDRNRLQPSSAGDGTGSEPENCAELLAEANEEIERLRNDLNS